MGGIPTVSVRGLYHAALEFHARALRHSGDYLLARFDRRNTRLRFVQAEFFCDALSLLKIENTVVSEQERIAFFSRVFLLVFANLPERNDRAVLALLHVAAELRRLVERQPVPRCVALRRQ
jgi:hypothetical protein